MVESRVASRYQSNEQITIEIWNIFQSGLDRSSLKQDSQLLIAFAGNLLDILAI